MIKTATVYVTDAQGFDLAIISAASIGLSRSGPCDIIIFCHKFTAQPQPRLSAELLQRGIRLLFRQIEDTAVDHHETHKHVTTPSLLKLRAVANLVSEYDRIVFLDNDVLTLQDLKLQELELGAYPIAAVIDMDISNTGAQRHNDWRTPVSRSGDIDCYFNSGVMIFESSNWRNEFLAQYAEALDEHDRGCVYKIDCTSIDQCALNSVFKNNWMQLPIGYNMQASAKFTGKWETAFIRHYCGSRKFLPLSPFRSDGKDVRHLNAIHHLLGRRTTRWGVIYQMLYSLNRIRRFRSALSIRKFLRVYDSIEAPEPLAK